MSFSPSIGPNKFGLFKDLNKCICSLTLKRYYAKLGAFNTKSVNLTPEVIDDDVTLHSHNEVLQVLEELWAEGNIESETQGPFQDPDIIHTGLKPPSIFIFQTLKVHKLKHSIKPSTNILLSCVMPQ